MMRSLFSGVSGLQNHQVRMDVIGNNISNVNTTGFKKGRVNFQDLISQNFQGAARPNERVGGVNPQQVGLGMLIASIDTIFTQGSLQTTGVKTDVSIQGEGFFILREGDNNLYTRAGAFGLDENGTLVNPANGMRVQGWSAQTEGAMTFINASDTPGDLVIPVGEKDEARATGFVFAASNLDKRTPVIPPGAGPQEIAAGTHSVTKEIYDAFGGTHQLRIDYTRIDGAPNQWLATVTVNANTDDPIQPTLSLGGIDSPDNTYVVEFDNFGRLVQASNAAGGLDTEGNVTIDATFLVPDTSIPVDPTTGLAQAPATQTITIDIGAAGGMDESTTQFSSASTNKLVRQDGYPLGYLEDFRIDQSGVITGIFSNGTNRALGQLALASFINPGGLEKNGENNYVVSINSGNPMIDPPGAAGKGKVIAGTLEMSNVDLAEQFTDMIITQRGFQANSRTIQTADQLLQEVLTLKR
ncbi:MAG: flagellar hook protein FlgE [Spirochaetaceae bacterium]|nr:MAG: flagellar hook protein FlgE [Spirochaetaceae bacterium]